MLDAAGLSAWARAAKAGAVAVYYRGEAVPRAIGAAALRLQEQGLVDLTRRRDGSGFQFIVQRRAKPFPASGDRRRRRTITPGTPETMILRMVRDAIRLGQPCPTNAEFAKLTGLSGRVAASYRLRKLERAGKLMLVDHGPLERRVAILPDTGLATARAAL